MPNGIGLSDALTEGFMSSIKPTETVATGGLWDWLKTQASDAWGYAKDLGARVISHQVLPAAPAPAPMPAPKPPLIVAAPEVGLPPVFDWQLGSGQSPTAPMPTAVGGIPITIILIGGAALLLMSRGK